MYIYIFLIRMDFPILNVSLYNSPEVLTTISSRQIILFGRSEIHSVALRLIIIANYLSLTIPIFY